LFLYFCPGYKLSFVPVLLRQWLASMEDIKFVL
jgi:hypothetical protein